MRNVMVAGAGKIGSLIAYLLAHSKSYKVHLADLNFTGSDVTRLLALQKDIKTVALDVTSSQSIQTYLHDNRMDALISCLPYFLNTHIAKAAKDFNAHYFDLTEDNAVTKAIKELALGAKAAFVPQCGLAPGFTGIVANSLMQEFDVCQKVKLRVGALPERVSNALQYSLTWSTDGVINSYGNPCLAIESRQVVLLRPLEDLEAIQIDGNEYEAFNTSGGLGSLTQLHSSTTESMNYKTLRYPGHCDKMRFLMADLGLNQDRATLKRILEKAIPKTYQDVAIIYVSVTGYKHGDLSEKSYLKKLYPKVFEGLEWSAIQVSTATSLCAVLDLVFKNKCKGLIFQEQFKLSDVLNNRFGRYFV